MNKYLSRVNGFCFSALSLIILGCSPDSSNKKSDLSKEFEEKQKLVTYSQVIDPSTCPNNPEGYIYFKLGDETFRYTKDSPIQLRADGNGKIFENDELRLQKLDKNEVPIGCAGNPYRDVGIQYVFKETDENYKKIRFLEFHFHTVNPEKRNTLSSGEKSKLLWFNTLKNKHNNCIMINEYTEKCGFPNEIQKKGEATYLSKTKIDIEKYFSMVCMSFVGDVKCSTYYRLYPSFDITYSFYLNENKNWKELNLHKLDSYIRSSFEKNRVK